MKSDAELRQDIEREFRWDPALGGHEIHVIVRGGVVTLSGRVDSNDARSTAEEIAACVTGVRGISNDIRIRLPSSMTAPDLWENHTNRE